MYKIETNKLEKYDFLQAIRRLPDVLTKVMVRQEWVGKVFIGGGYLRSCVENTPINDIDIFTLDSERANQLKEAIVKITPNIKIWKTHNAWTLTLPGSEMVLQIIHRWTFEKPEDVAKSFDFTNCCAVIYTTPLSQPLSVLTKEGREHLNRMQAQGVPLGATHSNPDHYQTIYHQWDSYVDGRFYPDVAAKRLTYRQPIRNEDGGGSMIRVLKYYQKGYRIPLEDLAFVIARLLKSVNWANSQLFERTEQIEGETYTYLSENYAAKIIKGLLNEVDPNIDPSNNPYFTTNELPWEEENNVNSD